MSIQARRVVNNFGWVAVARYVSRVTGFVTTLVLAKLLSPKDFGLVAICAMMIEVLKLFKDMGLGQALIHRREEWQEASHTAFLLLIIVNFVLFLIAVAISPLVADFYDNDAVMPVLIVMSSNLIWFSLRAVPDALITKRVEFKKLVVPETVPPLLGAVVAIAMAYHGFGVWSLVAKALIVDILGSVLIWRYTHFRPTIRFDRRIASELLQYGKFVVGNSVLAVALYSVDRFYISKFAGIEALGIYTLAFMVANLPTTEIAQIVSRVMFPVFTMLNQDIGRLGATLVNTMRFSAMIVVPMALGIVLYGPAFVDVVYGSQWVAMVIPMQLLSGYAVFRALSGILHELFKAVGQPRLSQRFTAWRLGVLLVLGVPAIKLFGIAGVCGLLALIYAVIFIWEARFACNFVGLPIRNLVVVLLRPTLGALVIVLTVFALLHAVAPSLSSLLTMAVGVPSTAIAYLLFLALSERAAFRDIRQLMGSGKGAA